MTAAERIEACGYEDVLILKNCSYDDALIGVTDDNRAVYAYDKMVQWLVDQDGMSEEEAVEWIAFNTVRALEYAGPDAPIIVYTV